MKINSESILTLDANKNYYIANSTFGVGDGRAKV